MSEGAAAECDCACALPPPGAFGAPLRLACSACCGAGRRLAAAARAELRPRGLLRPRSTRGGVACGRGPPSTGRSYASAEPPPAVAAASGAWGPGDGEPGGAEPGGEACWEVPEGAPCALPFVLRGRVVADCAAAPGGGTWCPYDVDAWSSGSGGWGFCAPPPAGEADPESLLDEYARTGVLPRNTSEPLPEWDVYVTDGVLPRNASEPLPEWEEHGVFPLAPGGAFTGGPGGDGAVTAQEALNWGAPGGELQQQRAPSSLGPGAIAGVAVGVAAVAVLAGLAGFAAFRRTAEGKRARLADPEKEGAGGGGPGAAGGGGGPGDRSSVAALVGGESDLGSFRSSRAESCAGGKELPPLSPVWPHAAPEPPSELYAPGAAADSASSDADTPPPSRSSSTFSDPASEGDPFLDSPLAAVVKAAAAKAAAGPGPLAAPPTPPRRWGHPHTPRSWDRAVGPADRV